MDGALARVVILALGLLAGASPVPAPAQDPLQGLAWAVVPEAELAQLRGGLIRGDGFELTLGIQRLTAINGEVVARTVLRDPAGQAVDATSLAGVQVRSTLEGLRIASLEDLPGVTVVQNALDRQIITSHTLMDVGLRGVDLSGTDLGRLLDAEIIQGLRGY
ncbi:hypothetical protein CKO33_06675 [Ectothiorhodospira mobilis]|nr:hypothetical protein [Ectothiorhodospira mobilis]